MNWFLLGALILVLCALANALLHRHSAKKNDKSIRSLWQILQMAITGSRKNSSWGEQATRDSSVVQHDPRHAMMVAEQHSRSLSAAIREHRRNRRHHKKPAPSPHSKINTASPPSASYRPNRVIDDIHFSYIDQNGQHTARTVAVVAVNSHYFEGFCELRQDTRSFSIERVRGEVTSMRTGEVMRPLIWARQAQKVAPPPTFDKERKPKRRTKQSWQPAIYFAGFRGDRQSSLEQIAETAGWQTRGGFSRTLDAMVTGPHTGSRQLEQAAELGIEIMTEEEFMARTT